MVMDLDSEDGSTALIERARLGDQDAWSLLFESCYPKIHRVISRRLSFPMRRYYDSTDIANEVMQSLHEKFGKFNFSSIGGLHAFLIRAAEQKLIDEHRKRQAKKRSVGRERPLGAGDDALPAWELADKSPTASQVAVASEERARILDRPSGPEREVLDMKSQGYSNLDASEATGWKIRKVERFLEKVRGTLRI